MLVITVNSRVFYLYNVNHFPTYVRTKSQEVYPKYTDDIVGLGVRKWTKPTSFEGLRLAPQATCDVFKTSGAKDYLSADFIKSLLNIKGKHK